MNVRQCSKAVSPGQVTKEGETGSPGTYQVSPKQSELVGVQDLSIHLLGYNFLVRLV